VKVVLVVLGVLAVAALLWLGLDQRREDCIRDGRESCSVLPWENSPPPPPKPSEEDNPLNLPR
jgi:hypothetical protein